ncbi:MAG: glycosyltransferase [Gammaproteobacteria bacterium]
MQRFKERFVEYAKFDSRLLGEAIGIAGLAATTVMRATGRGSRALEIETSMHRNAFSRVADGVVSRRVKRSIARPEAERLERYVATLTPQRSTDALFRDPQRLLGQRIIALKSPANGEKGALLLDYSFVFSLFARSFDVERIAERYHIIVEPSWSGSCDRDVLSLAGRPFPVFVQNNEPRDIEFIRRLGLNLVSVPIAANWWVDPRVFRPLEGAVKECDVLMNSAWARFKRHESFFEVLAKLRARGERLRVRLIGYRMDMTRDDVMALAQQHGVADQIETFEGLRPEQVNEQLNHAKVNLVWSRREGSNRAIIEGFSAGVPGILRKGFNYGYHYPYINPRTGAFATEAGLSDTLLDIIRNPDRYDPRTWVMQNMTPQLATKAIDDAIARHAARSGEKWTPGTLAVKVTSLHSMAYWDEAERPRFEPDYAFLRSALRPR